MKPFLIKAGGVLALVVVVVAYKVHNMKSASADVKSEMVRMLPRLPDYERDTAYFEALVEKNHDRAFDEAFDPGGRYRAATFDREKYLTQLYTLMVRQAQKDQRTWVVSRLKQGRPIFQRALSGRR